MSLKGKIAFVTGGSRGIGAAIAERLAKDGADVVITYSKSPDKANEVVAKIKGLGVRALALQANAEKPEAVAAAVDQAAKEFGGINIIVNNAGIMGEGGIDVGLDAYDKVLDVNVRSVISGTLAAVKHMKSGGRVINISSVLGERAMTAGISPYNMSKFAVAGLTRSWAHGYGARGITVNAIMPGPVDTDMNPDSPDNPGAEGMKQSAALKRYGKPEEIAAAVAFLARDDSSLITGATIRADGGISA